MKKLYLCVVILFLLTFTACGSDVLSVKSVDYEGLTRLTAAEPDEETIKRWTFITVNPYHGYNCVVSVSDGKLVISDSEEIPMSFVANGDYGYFVGVRDRHSDNGWVQYCEYYGALPAEKLEIVETPPDPPRIIVNEGCRGFIKINNGLIYLLTGDSFSTGTGGVYALCLEYEKGEWVWERIATLPEAPHFHVYDAENKMIYMVTSSALISFSLADYSVTTLADLHLWEYSGTTSLVQLNGKLYVGMPMGIYEYDLADGGTKWYPMPYEKLIPKEKWNPQYDEDDARMYEELGFVVY